MMKEVQASMATQLFDKQRHARELETELLQVQKQLHTLTQQGWEKDGKLNGLQIEIAAKRAEVLKLRSDFASVSSSQVTNSMQLAESKSRMLRQQHAFNAAVVKMLQVPLLQIDRIKHDAAFELAQLRSKLKALRAVQADSETKQLTLVDHISAQDRQIQILHSELSVTNEQLAAGSATQNAKQCETEGASP